MRILFHYIIPNGIYPIIANTTMGVAQRHPDGGQPELSGPGRPQCRQLGPDDPCPGKSYLRERVVDLALFAGLAIMLVVIVFYMIGDGLNYAMNPKLQSRK